MFTLTIYFIALNVYVEFVLIYRPHPVYRLQHMYILYTRMYASNIKQCALIKVSPNL
jgi:hypothetical protein